MGKLLRASTLVAVVVGSACASAGTGLTTPTPAEIPLLEARFTAEPQDVETGLYLASGYREAGRVDDAHAVVAILVEQAPGDPGVLVMQGMLAEDAGDFGAAVEAYQAFLATGTEGALQQEVERRLERARMEALRADVRDALSREATLAQTEPDPSTVGIFPFVFEGASLEYEPLALVLPELLTTDLGITGRLTVVERTKIQALINELQLGESGRVEEATAARSGRLLGSGHIVQGRFRMEASTRIDVDASVVTVGPPGQELVDPLGAQDEIERFFELEKQLAFAIYDELGVQLTPAERELVNERQTESIEALLAFGRGLAAADAGDFGQARQHYADAATLDPTFALARTRLNRASILAVPAPALRIAGQIARQAHRIGSKQAAVRFLTNAPMSMRERVLSTLGSQKRAILAELLGQDRVGQVILLELVFRGPGGGP